LGSKAWGSDGQCHHSGADDWAQADHRQNSMRRPAEGSRG
jgi:hypothetical protein